MSDYGSSLNFRPIRTEWIVDKLGWAPTPPESVIRGCAIPEDRILPLSYKLRMPSWVLTPCVAVV